MGKPVFRMSPGCVLSCPACDVRCAILAGEAHDAWRALEQLRRQQGGLEQAATMKRAGARLAAAERAFARARPSGLVEAHPPAWFRTCGSERLH